MTQRRLRLGDVLDDYCPRERRITNHAVVAMIDDTVKQTRCTTCNADHEYRDGKLPAPRRRKAGAGDGVLVDARPRRVAANGAEPVLDSPDEAMSAANSAHEVEPAQEQEPLELAAAEFDSSDEDASDPPQPDRDEWPVHRPLIRATLPRPEGQSPERKATDFTVRPAGSGGRFDAPRNNGPRNRGHRPMRHGQGQGPPSGQGPRFGGSRPGPGQGSGQGPRHGAVSGGPRHGSGPNAPQGQRQGNRPAGGGGRPGQGPGRGPRPGGAGRKRGR